MRAKTPRTSQPLNPRLDKMIAAYATAASAVGVSLLAAAPSAEAKIVYTKTRVTISTSYHLDLNHDGIGDFNIGFCSCEPEGTPLVISSRRNAGNSVITPAAVGFSYSAAALVNGAPIGPKQAFKPLYGALMVMASTGTYSGKQNSFGQWVGATNRYLGLKFMINGEVHYGWARLTVSKHVKPVVLTGYAYETIANKPLKAGQTSEAPQDQAKNSDTFARPAEGPSLGMLARGAEAIEVWRKKEEEAA